MHPGVALVDVDLGTFPAEGEYHLPPPFSSVWLLTTRSTSYDRL